MSLKGEIKMAKEKKFKQRKSGLDRAITTVLVLVVLVVLGLSAYSIYMEVESRKPQPYTIQTAAEEKGLTVDDFKTEYGIAADVTADTLFEEAMKEMTMANYAKFAGTTFEEMTAGMELNGEVTADTLYKDAEPILQEKYEEMAAAQAEAPVEGEVPAEGEAAPVEGEAAAETTESENETETAPAEDAE